MQFILEGFPGIGPKTAKKLLKEFKSLKNLFNSPTEKLQEVIGKKGEIFISLIFIVDMIEHQIYIKVVTTDLGEIVGPHKNSI